MMCYRDMTFCTEDTCTVKDNCLRYFSKYHKKASKEWWGGNDAPICTFRDRPQCYNKGLGDVNE